MCRPCCHDLTFALLCFRTARFCSETWELGNRVLLCALLRASFLITRYTLDINSLLNVSLKFLDILASGVLQESRVAKPRVCCAPYVHVKPWYYAFYLDGIS